MIARWAGSLGVIAVVAVWAGCSSKSAEPSKLGVSQAADITDCPNQFSFGGVTWCSTPMGLDQRFGNAPWTGHVTVSANSVSVTGNGDGVAYDEPADDDGVMFVYTRLPHATDASGAAVPVDSEIAVHITPGAALPRLSQMGVMIRASTDPVALTGAGFFDVKTNSLSCDPNEQRLGNVKMHVRSQIPGFAPTVSAGYRNVRIDTGIWLRLQRVGRDFVVERSTDGTTWIPVGGSEFTSDDALIGFFVAGNGDDVTDVFDDIYVGPPRQDYRSTWIGTSYAKLSTGFVGFGMHDFYVAPDGTVYKYSQAAEQNSNLNVFDPNGKMVKLPPGNLSVFGFYQGGIAGDPDFGTIYLGARASATPCQPGSHVERRRASDLAPIDGGDAGTLDFGTPTLGLIGGLAASHGKVYLSDVAVNDTTQQGLCPYSPTPPPPARNSTIRVLDTEGTNTLVKFDFTDRNGVAATPGPLAVDDGGDIWAIQEAADYPVLALGACLNQDPQQLSCPDPPGSCYLAGGQRQYCPCSTERSIYPGTFTPRREGLIQCRHADGSRCTNGGVPVEITAALAGYSGGSGFNPVGVTIDRGASPTDPSDDRLLVADNGTRQDIVICTNLHAGTLTCSPYGAVGGVFSGPAPGLVNDPANGGWRRFFSPLKAAADSHGNVYVASTAPEVDIRKFDTSGALAWSDFGLSSGAGSFDPATDGQDYYTTSMHFSFDTSKTQAGSEWSLKGINWNPFDGTKSSPTRMSDALYSGGLGGMQMRRIGGNLFGYQVEDYSHLRFYRYSGETSVPFGSLELEPVRDGDSCDPSVPDIPGCLRLWIDADGDGVEDRGTDPDPCKPCDGYSGTCEVQTIPSANLPAGGGYLPDVDQQGHIWLGWPHEIWELPTVTTSPVPTYALSTHNSTPLPSAVAGPALAHFDATSPNQTMYLVGGKPGLPEGCTGTSSDPCVCGYPVYEVARFDNWRSTPTLAAGYPVVLPNPEHSYSQPDAFDTRFGDVACTACGGEGYAYQGFDVAGDYFFVQQRTAEVLVYDARTGAQVTHLNPGPEISGDAFWVDMPLPGSLRAFKRSNGEYLVTEVDSSNQARSIVFRYSPVWTPGLLAPIAWYQANPSDITLSGSQVAQWADHSGHGQTLVNNFEPGRPVYNATGWNSAHPSVSFNGGALLRRDSWSGVPAGSNQPFSVLAVVQTAGSTSEGSVLAWWSSTGGYDVRCNVTSQGAQNLLDMTRGDGWASDQSFAGSTFTPGRHVVAWRFAPDSFQLTVDGTTDPSGSLSPMDALSFDTLVMGAKTTLPTGLFNGNVSEVVVVPSHVSDDDIVKFRQYAQTTWGGLP